MFVDGYDGVRLSFDFVEPQDAKSNEEKTPIIFLHAMTLTKESWKNVLHIIAASTGRKVYAYDARNHGDSGWSDEFNDDLMLKDLLQFMDNILSQKAIIVGHSMGGKTAMFLATEKPERVEKLIVEDISPIRVVGPLLAGAEKYVRTMRDALDSIPQSVKDLKIAKEFVNQYLLKDTSTDLNSAKNKEKALSRLPLYQDEYGKFKWKTNFKVLEKFLKKLPDVSGLYSGPTLMIYGAKSPYKISADIDYIKRTFPQAKMRAIEGAFHQVHEEFEDVFIKEVVDFINDS